MSAAILDFQAIHSVRAQDAMARAAHEVRAQLPGLDESRISAAIERAERHIRRDVCVTFAVRRAVAWARYADPDGPEAA